MIFWFMEIPLIMVVFAAIALCVIGSMFVGWVARALFGVGLIMMVAAIPILIVSAALQHVSEQKVKMCDKVMKFLCINGGILFTLGFFIICLFEMSIIP